MPADHIIREGEKFLDILKPAEIEAQRGYLITLALFLCILQRDMAILKLEKKLPPA